MMKPALSLSAALVLSAAAAAATAQEETPMTMDQVPAAVMEAARAANTTGADFTSVALDDGIYEFAGTTADGMGFEIDVAEDGTIEEIERQIAYDALPEAVRAALEAEMPGFEPTYVEESTRADGSVVYEFEGTHEGSEIDAEINADGTGFSRNDDRAG
jgi:hypothetical protein